MTITRVKTIADALEAPRLVVGARPTMSEEKVRWLYQHHDSVKVDAFLDLWSRIAALYGDTIVYPETLELALPAHASAEDRAAFARFKAARKADA
jgi:hypothetical protein